MRKRGFPQSPKAAADIAVLKPHTRRLPTARTHAPTGLGAGTRRRERAVENAQPRFARPAASPVVAGIVRPLPAARTFAHLTRPLVTPSVSTRLLMPTLNRRSLLFLADRMGLFRFAGLHRMHSLHAATPLDVEGDTVATARWFPGRVPLRTIDMQVSLLPWPREAASRGRARSRLRSRIRAIPVSSAPTSVQAQTGTSSPRS